MKAFSAVWSGLAIAGVLLAGTAMAQPSGNGLGEGPGFAEHRPPMEKAFGPQGEHGRWWNNPKVVERLKLTEEQRKAFDGILLQHRKTLIDLRANVEKAELEMEPLMGEDQPNEAKVLAQIDKVAQARAELEKANARFLLAIRNKLTPEQWKQMEAYRASRGFEGREGGQRRGPGPKGQEQGGQDHQAPPPPSPQGADSQAPGETGAGQQAPAPPQEPAAPGMGDEQ
jgi:Spy/CpxP family protein refolding chaperone